MERIQADELVSFASRLESLNNQVWVKKQEEWTADERKQVLDSIAELFAISRKIGTLEIPSALDQMQRIKNVLSNPDSRMKYPYGWHLVYALQERFMDDLGRCFLLVVPKRDAELLQGKQLFGASVFERFPSATVDIEEAGNCLALARSTAAVFHLMRVMEAGLKVTANALGVDYAPSWESYLRQMQPLIEMEWKKKPLKWRKDEAFFKHVYTHLHGVKLSWRNPTMHIVQNYTPEMADDVWSAVKTFMRHLSTKLSENTTRRKDAIV